MPLPDTPHKLFDNLERPMELDSINRDLWNDKCDYIDVSDCPNLNPNGHTIYEVC